MLTRKHVEQYIRFLETSDVGEPAEALEMGKTLEISTGMRMFDIGKAIAHMALRSLDEPGFVRVPVEPKKKMCDAGDEAIRLGLLRAQAGMQPINPDSASAEVWEAMLSAAREEA